MRRNMTLEGKDTVKAIEKEGKDSQEGKGESGMCKGLLFHL